MYGHDPVFGVLQGVTYAGAGMGVGGGGFSAFLLWANGAPVHSGLLAALGGIGLGMLAQGVNYMREKLAERRLKLEEQRLKLDRERSQANHKLEEERIANERRRADLDHQAALARIESEQRTQIELAKLQSAEERHDLARKVQELTWRYHSVEKREEWNREAFSVVDTYATNLHATLVEVIARAGVNDVVIPPKPIVRPAPVIDTEEGPSEFTVATVGGGTATITKLPTTETPKDPDSKLTGLNDQPTKIPPI